LPFFFISSNSSSDLPSPKKNGRKFKNNFVRNKSKLELEVRVRINFAYVLDVVTKIKK